MLASMAAMVELLVAKPSARFTYKCRFSNLEIDGDTSTVTRNFCYTEDWSHFSFARTGLHKFSHVRSNRSYGDSTGNRFEATSTSRVW